MLLDEIVLVLAGHLRTLPVGILEQQSALALCPPPCTPHPCYRHRVFQLRDSGKSSARVWAQNRSLATDVRPRPKASQTRLVGVVRKNPAKYRSIPKV